jgi:hypothetical protein
MPSTDRTDALASPAAAHGSARICSPLPLHLENGCLVVPPFRLTHLHQHYTQETELRIQLSRIVPDLYRVVAVHNFWAEDTNPDLSQCIAAIFLGRRRLDGTWETAENWPLECREVARLAYLEIDDGATTARLFPHDHQY